MKTKIFIADDHRMIIDGIKAMFEKDPEIEVVGHALSVEEALKHAEKADYDLLILDIRFGEDPEAEEDGFDVLKKVKELYPKMRVLMLTSHEEPTYIRMAMDHGANGYLLKNTGKSDFRNAIQTVMSGDFYLAGKVAEKIIGHAVNGPEASPTIEISTRELEVIKLICDEYTTEEIAQKLNVQLSTIKTHRKNILAKLKVRNVAGIVRYAVENELLD